jgi:hypothetical protein
MSATCGCQTDNLYALSSQKASNCGLLCILRRLQAARQFACRNDYRRDADKYRVNAKDILQTFMIWRLTRSSRGADMRVLILALLGVLSVSCAWGQDAANLFDKPLQDKQVRLPRDPLNPHMKPEVACFYYPGLMIKQIDLGEKGAARLSIIPVRIGKTAPPCARTLARDERVISTHSNWSGYFKGVKYPFVFFTADDGSNGGEGFAVFTEDGNKIFSDLSGGLHSFELLNPRQKPDERPWNTVLFKLRYERVYLASCSLRADPDGCWKIIQQATGLSEATPPDCSASYEAEEKRLPTQNKQEITDDPSVIFYEMETVLDDLGTVVRVTPASKATACWAAQ